MLLVLCSKYCYFKNFIFEMFDLKRKITIILITFKRSYFSIFFLFHYYSLLFYDRYTIFGQFVVCFDFN